MNNARVSHSLDLDQAQRFVWPNQGLKLFVKVIDRRRQRVIGAYNFNMDHSF